MLIINLLSMNEIKDQARLFKKLFMAPSASSNDLKLILSMQFLKLLLDQVHLLAPQPQKALLIQILRLFQHQPINSLLLYQHDQLALNETPLLTLIIRALSNIAKTKQEMEELLPFVQSLLCYYQIGLIHISFITKELGIQFHLGKFNPLKARFYHLILERYYKKKDGLESMPLHFFFFYGKNENSAIRPIKPLTKIKNEISIALSFNLLSIDPQGTLIFFMATDHETITLKVGKYLTIHNDTTGHKYQQEEYIQTNKWYHLIINLSHQQTTVFLNREQINQSKSLLKKQKQRQIRQFSIGEQMIGFMGAVIVSDKMISSQKVKQFPDFQTLRSIKYLIQSKMYQHVIFSCIPYLKFQMSNTLFFFDLFCKAHSMIGQNTFIYNNRSNSLGIVYLGGYETLLPLFYLARFYNHEEYPDQLQLLLKIWLAAVQNFKDNQLQEQFLLILGHHLEPLHLFLNQQCVKLLACIQERLTKNKILFLKHIAWSGLPGRSSGKGVQAWLEWLTKLYQTNKGECLRAHGLMDIIFWLVKYLENVQQECCAQHYWSQARIVREFSLSQLRSIELSTRRQHFQAVENIATMILSYLIVENKALAIKEIKSVLRLLLHKYSSCLYLTILRVLKRQFSKFQDDKLVCSVLLEANILPFLAATAEKVVDPTLITQIIHIMLIISRHSTEMSPQIIQFIDLVLKRMSAIDSQKFNILAKGAKKIRKRSVDSKQGPKQSFTDLIGRISSYKQNFQNIKFLLLNLCCGIVAEQQLPVLNRFLQFQPGFKLLKSFLLIVGRKIRLQAMQQLLLRVVQGQSNLIFCQNSVSFNQILLLVADKGKIQQMKIVQEIISRIFHSQLARKVNIGDYYLLLKNLSRSQVSIRQILIHAFLSILNQEIHLSLIQLYQLLLIFNNENHHYQQMVNGQEELLSLLSQAIFKALKVRLIGEKAVMIKEDMFAMIEVAKDMSLQLLQMSWLQMQVQNQSDQLVDFLFDSLLPKIMINSSISPLLKDFKRQVYLYEIFIYNLITAIDHSPQLLNSLLQTLLLFIIQAIVNKEEDINKSFIRMMIFIVSHYLVERHEIQMVIVLWNFILSFIQKQALQLKAKSYVELGDQMKERGFQPFLVQIFEVFLRQYNESYVISFEEMMEASTLVLRQEMIKKKLLSMLRLQQLGMIWDVCRKYALDRISQQYQGKIKSSQYRFDMQPKDQQYQVIFKSVEKIFQQESIGQEETRLQYLQEHETFIRKYHKCWNELWKKLRLYHHPYALFIAQKNNQNKFLFAEDELKNYRYKMSKYSTKSGVYPILQAQIEEPWHVKKSEKLEKKKEIGNLAQLMRPSQAHRKKNDGMIDNIVKFVKKFQKARKETTGDYQVVWIKRGNKARGKVMINDNKELIFWYQSLKQEDSHLSFEPFSLPIHKEMVKSWSIHHFKQVARRRYLMKYQALEILLTSETSLLFQFENNRQQQFLTELSQLRTEVIEEFGHKLKLNSIPFYGDQWFSHELSPRIMDKWRRKKMTNLQYLVQVNRAASRNIYDISQYPVLPWICYMSQDKQPVMRDLTQTVGSLGSEERKKVVTQKYNAADPFNPFPPFFFGTHYSSPGVVFNFLIRIAPFTDYCKNLQGGKFDIADRLFSSFLNVWKSAFNEVSDVRQLIPEFYYIPECLINLQRLRLGTTQSGEVIDEVQLPDWAAKNPYFLTVQLRQMLESQESTAHISDWIDLIFGYKQRGEEAKKNFNIYYYLTYEDYSNCLDEKQDEVYRKSCEAQIVHFGQIPPLLLEKQHPKPTVKLSENPVELIVIRKINLINNLKDHLIGIQLTSTQLILVKRDCIEVLTTLKSPAAITKIIPFNFQKTISSKLFCIKKQYAKIFFFRHFFLVYGYITNQFRIFNRTTGEIEYDYSVDSRIEHALINEEQSLIILGCLSGMLYIFQVQYGNSKLSARQVYSEMFMHPVSHISEHDGFFTISFGCFASIYKIQRSLHYLGKQQHYPFVKFFRTFKNNISVRAAFIANNPLYCLLMIDNSHLKVYSMNGQFIKSISCSPKHYYQLKDKHLNSLFCLVQESRMVILSTPDLRCVSEMELSGGRWLSKMLVHEREILQIGLS